MPPDDDDDHGTVLAADNNDAGPVTTADVTNDDAGTAANTDPPAPSTVADDLEPGSGYTDAKAKVRPKPKPTDPVVLAAVEWARKQNLGPEMVKQVQAKVGVQATGTYDAVTADAVRTWQKQNRSGKDGKAGPGTCSRMGVIYHTAPTAGSVDLPTWNALKAAHPDGVVVMGAVYYGHQSNNNKEFIERAKEMAPQHKAVVVKDGKLVIGDWYAIRAVGDIVTNVLNVHATLERAWRTHDHPPQGAAPPAYTRIKDLSLLSHGKTAAMSTNAKNSYSKGLVGSKAGGTENLKSFVGAIKGALSDDVDVQLFACNTGRTANTKEAYKDWVGKGDVVGETSFAQELADVLDEHGKDGSVYGHTTRGHLSRNYASRVYGAKADAAAGKDVEGGVSMFDVLFSDAILQAEVDRIYGAVAEPGRDKVRQHVEKQAWRYYKNMMSVRDLGIARPDWPTKPKADDPDYATKKADYDKKLVKAKAQNKKYEAGVAAYTGRLKDEGIATDLGDACFINPEKTRDEVLPRDFAQWVAKTIGSFSGKGPVTDAAKAGTPRQVVVSAQDVNVQAPSTASTGASTNTETPDTNAQQSGGLVTTTSTATNAQTVANTPSTEAVTELKPLPLPKDQVEDAFESLPERADILDAGHALRDKLRKEHGAKWQGFGYGEDQLVCTTFVSKILSASGYTIDSETESKLQMHDLSSTWSTLINTDPDDQRLRGVANAMTSSGQALDVPMSSSAPAKHLRPGDVFQWWHSGGGHASFVEEVVSDTTIKILASQSSTKGIGNLTVDLTASKWKVLAAARPYGSNHFVELVAMLTEEGKETGRFQLAADGESVVVSDKRAVDVAGPKTNGTVKSKSKPTAVAATPSHSDLQASLAQSHEGALEPTHGMDDGQLADKADWDCSVSDYRALLKHKPDAVTAQREAGIGTTASSAAAQQHSAHAANEASVHAELDAKRPVLFKQKIQDKRRQRLEYLGLLGKDFHPATLAEEHVDAAGGEPMAGDKALIAERVASLVNRLYFDEGAEDLTREDIAAMTSELTSRFLAGRAAQQYLGDVAAYWRHFQVDKRDPKERKALKSDDPEAFKAYKTDRQLTKTTRWRHSKLNKLARAATGRAKKPHKSPSPTAIAALVGAGENAPDALEGFVRAQLPVGPAAARSATPFDGALEARVDTVQSLGDLESVLQEALQPLGLSKLPGAGDAAADLKDTTAHAEAKPENFESAAPAEESLKPHAYLTVVFKRLVELVLGIHAEPTSSAPRLDDLRAGDKVPVTQERRDADGKVWAQALVDAPQGGARRVGWLDTEFTNEARGETGADAPCDERPRQQTLAGTTPHGLTVTQFLRPNLAGAILPAFRGVYPEDTKSPIAEVCADPLALLPQTADNDPDYLEVLVNDHPVYMQRDALRIAEPEERMVHLETLTVAEIQTCRAFATAIEHGPTKAAYFEALQQKPMFIEASRSSAVDGRQRGPLSALAMAFESLGLPIPYPEATSYADALEMVRLEQGLSSVRTATDAATLSGPFGVDAVAISPTEVAETMAAGRSILAFSADGRALRIAAESEDGYLVDDPALGTRHPLKGSTIAKFELLSLGVPTSYDDGTEERSNPALTNGAAVSAAYKREVFSGASQGEDDWYLNKSETVHGAETTDALKSWLAGPDEVAAMPPAAQQKAFARWCEKYLDGTLGGVIAVKTQFVAPLDALGGITATMTGELQRRTRTVLNGLVRRPKTNSAYTEALAALTTAKKHELLSTEQLATYLAQIEALRPVAGPEDADFAALWDTAGEQADPTIAPAVHASDGTAKLPFPVEGPIQFVKYARKGGKTFATLEAAGEPRYKDRLTLGVGDFQVTLEFAAKGSVLRGWAAVGGMTKIGGEPFSATYGDLIEAGMSPMDAMVTLVRCKMSPGSPVNAWDKVYLSLGFNQNKADASDDTGTSRLANVLGTALFDSPTAVKPGLAATYHMLTSAGVHLKPVGAQWAFEVTDPHLGDCKAGSGFGKQELNTLHEADRISFNDNKAPTDASYEALLEKMALPKHNRPALAMRTNPLQVTALAAAMAQPSVLASTATSYKTDVIDKVRQTSVGQGRKVADFEAVMTPHTLGIMSKQSNSQSGTATFIAKHAWTLVSQLEDPTIAYGQVYDPAAWAAAPLQFNEKLQAALLNRLDMSTTTRTQALATPVRDRAGAPKLSDYVMGPAIKRTAIRVFALGGATALQKGFAKLAGHKTHGSKAYDPTHSDWKLAPKEGRKDTPHNLTWQAEKSLMDGTQSGEDIKGFHLHHTIRRGRDWDQELGELDLGIPKDQYDQLLSGEVGGTPVVQPGRKLGPKSPNGNTGAQQLDLALVAEVVERLQAPGIRERLDAVYASPAGRRNLDRYCDPLFAEIDARVAAASKDADTTATGGRWTDRMAAYCEKAFWAADVGAGARLLKVLDVALDVADKYPELGSAPEVGDDNRSSAHGSNGSIQETTRTKLNGTPTHYSQMNWYDQGGNRLDKGVKQSGRKKDTNTVAAGWFADLQSLGVIKESDRSWAYLWGAASYTGVGEAYDNLACMPVSYRKQLPRLAGDNNKVKALDNSGRGHELAVSDAIMSEMPQLKFIPGSKSCNRAARAILGDGGVQSSDKSLFAVGEEWSAESENAGTGKGTMTLLVAGDFKKKAAKVNAVLEGNLAASPAKPTLLGISYKHRTDLNNGDKATDHYLVATHREGDVIVGSDPGTSQDKYKNPQFKKMNRDVKDPTGAVSQLKLWTCLGYKGATQAVILQTYGAQEYVSGLLSSPMLAKAQRKNRERKRSVPTIKAIQKTVGSSQTGDFDPETIQQIALWQSKNALAIDGIVGSASLEAMGVTG